MLEIARFGQKNTGNCRDWSLKFLVFFLPNFTVLDIVGTINVSK
jgi:hypothetical protein